MEIYTTKQQLLDDESEEDERKGGQREHNSCCRLLYSCFVLVVVCALVVFTFMVLMDVFRLARHPSKGKNVVIVFYDYLQCIPFLSLFSIWHGGSRCRKCMLLSLLRSHENHLI